MRNLPTAALTLKSRLERISTAFILSPAIVTPDMVLNTPVGSTHTFEDEQMKASLETKVLRGLFGEKKTIKITNKTDNLVKNQNLIVFSSGPPERGGLFSPSGLLKITARVRKTMELSLYRDEEMTGKAF